jgi:hypothetical protein
MKHLTELYQEVAATDVKTSHQAHALRKAKSFTQVSLKLIII